jgi:hypothetical protein
MPRFSSGSVALVVVVLVLGACITVGPADPAVPAAPAGPTARVDPTQPVAGEPEPPIQPPAQGGNLCDKLTLAEVSAAAGGTRAVLGEDYDEEGSCAWDVGELNDLGTPNAFVYLRRDFSNALDDQRELFPGGEDVAIEDDGYWSPDVNVLYFRKGTTIYAVQVVVVDAEAIDERELAIAIAQTAAPRL